MTKNGRYTYIDIPSTVMDQNLLDGIFDNTFTNPSVKKMSIYVDKDCYILINGVDMIKIKANLGLELSYEDIDVKTMIAKTNSVNFYAIVAY